MALQMSGEVTINAPIETVWMALNDKDVLGKCITGCQSIDWLSEDQLQAEVLAKVGPIKAKFAGKVTLSDKTAPTGYKITGEGSGGLAGFAKGGATVALRTSEAGTVVAYDVEAQVGGKIAQLGMRLIAGTAKKNADEFFNALATLLNSPLVATEIADTSPA